MRRVDVSEHLPGVSWKWSSVILVEFKWVSLISLQLQFSFDYRIIRFYNDQITRKMLQYIKAQEEKIRKAVSCLDRRFRGICPVPVGQGEFGLSVTLQFLSVSQNEKRKLWKQKQFSFPFWQSGKSEVKQNAYKTKLYKSRKLLLTGSSAFWQIFHHGGKSSIKKQPAHPICQARWLPLCCIRNAILNYSLFSLLI